MGSKNGMKNFFTMIPGDWLDRLEAIRGKRMQAEPGGKFPMANLGREAIREYIERNSDPGADPLSDPLTVGRPTTKETETDVGTVTQSG